ncbi:sigma-54 interaction domain-containing protein [Anaerobacillus isosaccharinicus]|uniref:Sigma 54-interacting transcriptional regulator n=1 Tax=Anaerobacillus isosaccharinicus TaxID=1532552 RepID=A0A1S2MIC9_9BACI|nr:sigma 54-interacting transcriptional regulator [Anaerobacillus isosaccharinicus]MBA5588850.1 sigma 54-interacting transcriptional regulator [Anaerobacillus isosaccharinicus]QOY37762.1 sigma 54-interacting transcriptional regulator [Anaerobacillus isosaccharinicus]
MFEFKDPKQLKKFTKFYQHVINEIDIGVHVIDESGKTVIYNQKMMEIEAMHVEDVINKSLRDVFMFYEDQESTLLQALDEGKTTKNKKQTYFNNKGQEITTINNTHPIIENGKVIGAIEIAKDITKLEKLIRENRAKTDTLYTFNSIIGESGPIKEVIEHAKRATRTSSSVLIIGETGTGKELFAQSIHHSSERQSKPFISQNCAALPESLIEGLLFGTKKGAFTGATERPGLFEQANGGTILLDEINSLSVGLQAKLLRVIQEKNLRRVGDTKDTPIDVRIIATMNEDPITAIEEGRLRNDLYYRLSVVSLHIPSLRKRKGDIPLLVNTFIHKFNRMFQMDVRKIDEEILRLFYEYDWPGNVRELEHVIEGAMNLMIDEDQIDFVHLPSHFRNKTQFKDEIPQMFQPSNKKSDYKPFTKPLKQQLEEFEEYYIERVLEQHNNNVTQASKQLGLSRQSLQYRIKKFH